LLLIASLLLLCIVSVAFAGNDKKKGSQIFDKLFKEEIKPAIVKKGFDEDEPEEQFNGEEENKGKDHKVYGQKVNKVQGNKGYDGEKIGKVNKIHENKGYDGEKGVHKESENHGYGNAFGEDRDEDRKFLSKSSRIFKFCSFSSIDCSSTPSCFVVENAKCFALPNGDSLKVDLTGSIGSAYYFSSVVNCSGVTPTYYLDQKIDSCFSGDTIGLSFSNLNF